MMKNAAIGRKKKEIIFELRVTYGSEDLPYLIAARRVRAILHIWLTHHSFPRPSCVVVNSCLYVGSNNVFFFRNEK